MVEKTKYYAGIGSRSTPPSIQDDMLVLAHDLRTQEWVLRSGGAKGADESFELGAQDRKEIFTAKSDISEKAFEIAQEIHPNWFACKPYVKRLLARNVLQVLGQNLDAPVDFVVCWTLDGCESDATRTIATGGTGQAISLASLQDIPVFNLANEGRLERVRKFME